MNNTKRLLKGKNMKQFIMGITLLILIVISGLLVWQSDVRKKEAFLDKYELNNLSVEEIVQYLERKTDEPADFKASITGSKLTLSDESTTLEINIPKGLFYLSFAPYIEKTHPCNNHNLVTCTGELKNVIFQVVVKNPKTGQEIFNGSLKSSSKGFVGIWLPKGETFIIDVQYQDFSSISKIQTFYNSNTCLTTLELKA